MTKDIEKLPDDVLQAIRMNMRGWILNSYVGGRRKLAQWNDHYASLISIQSYSLPGSTRSNLARLKKLANEGLVVLRQRVSGVYCFTLPRPALDQIAAEETARFERMGYVVGQLMPEITQVEAQ